MEDAGGCYSPARAAGAAEAPGRGEEECVTHQPKLQEQQKPLVEGEQEAATHQPELQEQQKPLIECEQEAATHQPELQEQQKPLVEGEQEAITHQSEQQWARTTRHCHDARDMTGKRYKGQTEPVAQ